MLMGGNNPYKFVDPDGRNGLGILGRYGLLGLAFDVGLVTVDTAVVGKAALDAATVSIAITSLVNGMLNEEATSSDSPDIDDLANAGTAIDPAAKNGKWTKAGRSLDKKTRDRKNSVFGDPLTGNEEDKNQAGQRALDDILSDSGTEIEVDARGQTTATAPDGRGAKWNSDG